MKCYLIDFDDSFTFNVYAELVDLGIPVEVINTKNAKDLLECLVSTKEKHGIVLGPGPGHPDERMEIISTVKKLMKSENIFLFGVCLGHQLVARAMGMDIQRSSRAVHGENVEIELESNWQKASGIKKKSIIVQRYNSLSAKDSLTNHNLSKSHACTLLTHEGEIMGIAGERLLTYQFHPESVGTSFRKGFFQRLKGFLL